MTPDAWLLPAGVVAGIANAIAGGGSLLTFPVFLAIGYSPYVANVTNAVGIFASNVGAVAGYRHELRRAPHLKILCTAGVCGSLIGCLLLLRSGEATFQAVVPVLILVSAGLILLQPKVVERISAQRGDVPSRALCAVFATAVVSIYGGYFGAAMGVMLIGLYGMFLHETLQRINAYKNGVAVCVNFTCVVVFALFGPVQWVAVAWMTAGTMTGGFIGSRIARRLPDRQLRSGMVLVAVIAALVVLLR